jgi:transcriptional regulator with XRE-family HTH domain
MTTGKKIELARREIDLSQESFADKIGVSRVTLVRYENDQVQKPDVSLLLKISKVTGKELSYFISEEEGDEHIKRAIAGSSDFSICSDFVKPKLPEISLANLYRKSMLSPLISTGKGDINMLKVLIDRDVEGSDLKAGDALEVSLNGSIEDNRYYLFRDGQIKQVVFRVAKKYGNKVILRKANGLGEDEFDPKRFELIGRVVARSL